MQEEEDISDEACLSRHDPHEAAERKRFRTFVTYPPARRTRLSRESESHSVEAMSPVVQEQFSTMETQPGSNIPYTVTYTVTHGKGKGESRRRSGSASSSRRESEDSFIQREVEPWTERVFPLPEDCYEAMKKEQEESLPKKRSYKRRVVKLDDEIEFVCPPDSGPPSPVQSESSRSVGEADDPDWTEVASMKSGSVKASKR